MGSTLTSRLKLFKPVPTSGENFRASDFNANMDKLDLGGNGAFACTSTTRPAAPFIGMEIFETDTGNRLFYYDPPSAAPVGWYQPWNQPWGQLIPTTLAYGGGLTNSYSPVYNKTLTNLSIGRRIKATTEVFLYSASFTGAFDMKYMLDGVMAGYFSYNYGGSIDRIPVHMEQPFTVTAASHIVRLDMMVTQSAGVGMDGGKQNYISYEDIGPA